MHLWMKGIKNPKKGLTIPPHFFPGLIFEKVSYSRKVVTMRLTSANRFEIVPGVSDQIRIRKLQSTEEDDGYPPESLSQFGY